MACNQYTLDFINDEVVTFQDCSGNTQTLSGKSGIEYFVCGQSVNLPPSGVSLTDNGPADFYFFSSCCGHYFFYFCLPEAPAFPVLTMGSQYIQFSDGLSTENKCTVYDVSVVPPTNYDIPYVTVLQKTGYFFDKTEQCNNCVANFPGNECEPYYFELCCCESTETPPPLDCYIAYISKEFFTLGDTYQFTLVDSSTTFCAKVVDPTTKNFYSVTEYIPTDLSSLDLIGGCLDCSEPCPTPTPTPTPTITVTPTQTPTLTPSVTPTITPSTKFINECEPLTIFNLGVSCSVVQPSTSKSNNGAASLIITGGTPPYKVYWDNGNISPAIGNLSVGEYGATVTDFYGDFTARTVCILNGVPVDPTPTPTPTPTLIPTGPNFCMNAVIEAPKLSTSIQQTFSVDSFVNGKPSWLSANSNYRVYWDSIGLTWKVSGTPVSFQIINTNPTTPPINSNWTIIGASGLVTVTEGSCPPELFKSNIFGIENPDINLFVVKTDTNCGCEGSIIADADGGNTPYQYSIDGGITYKNFPIFDDLCSGNYTVIVKDYSGYTKASQITINEPEPPTTYVVNVTKNVRTIVDNGLVTTKLYEAEITVTPELPDYATITFDFFHTNSFGSTTTDTSASILTNTVLKKNNLEVSFTTSNTSTGTSVNTLNGCQNQLVYNSATTEVWKSITMNNTDSYIINTTTSVVKNFITGCDAANSDDNYYITNITITGCECCTVQNVTL